MIYFVCVDSVMVISVLKPIREIDNIEQKKIVYNFLVPASREVP